MNRITIRSQVPGLSVHIKFFLDFLKLYFLNSPIQSSPLNSRVQRWLKKWENNGVEEWVGILPLLILGTMPIQFIHWSALSRWAHRSVVCIETIASITPELRFFIITPVSLYQRGQLVVPSLLTVHDWERHHQKVQVFHDFLELWYISNHRHWTFYMFE